MSKKSRHQEPRLPSGFRDLHPDECAGRDWMIERVCDVYKSFGFVPLDTSCVEYLNILVSGHEEGGEKQIYRLFKDSLPAPRKTTALRFELTASLARYLGQHIDRLPLPFKRYQSGYVWRGERPQRGRFRQFLQFDVDTVGVQHPMADTEIIEVIYRSMEAIGIGDFSIQISSRQLLSSLARTIGLITSEDQIRFFRILDKHDKIGTHKLLQLCAEPYDNNGLGFKGKQIDILERLITLEGSNSEKVESLAGILQSSDATTGLNEIETILGLWSRVAVRHPEYVRFVPHLARGLDYYTGAIFETIITGQESIGSVMSGGRYDGLIGHFLNRDLPAVGVSMGIDRLFVALKEMELLRDSASSCTVLISILQQDDSALMFELASTLRNAGISAELYLGSRYAFREQIKYAASRGIPYLLIQGEDERNRGTVSLRDLSSREQTECSLDQAIFRLRS